MPDANGVIQNPAPLMGERCFVQRSTTLHPQERLISYLTLLKVMIRFIHYLAVYLINNPDSKVPLVILWFVASYKLDWL